jgi:hypothetical protein
MENQPSTCPFCNALQPTEVLRQTRIRCFRCGETFVNRLAESVTSAPPRPDTNLTTTNPSKSNRLVAIGILGVMVLMALGGLGFALITWKQRQSRHPKSPVELQAVRPHVPADLPALGYLPVDCQFVVGIHVAELLRDPTGAKILEEPLPALLDAGLHAVEHRTGFSLVDIDHIVFGIAMDGIIPQMTAVVRTRRPYHLEEIAKAVEAKPLRHHNLPLFRIKLQPAGGGYLWCADEVTLVMVLRPDAVKIEDMDRIPATPRKASEGLPGPLREMLETRLRNGVLWLAGHVQDSKPFQTLAGLTRRSKSDADLLAKIKSAALAVVMEDDVTLIGALECRDAEGTAELEAFLNKLDFPGSKSRKIIGPPPKSVGQEARWVSLQIRCDPAGIRDSLEVTNLPWPRKSGQ